MILWNLGSRIINNYIYSIDDPHFFRTPEEPVMMRTETLISVLFPVEKNRNF